MDVGDRIRALSLKVNFLRVLKTIAEVIETQKWRLLLRMLWRAVPWQVEKLWDSLLNTTSTKPSLEWLQWASQMQASPRAGCWTVSLVTHIFLQPCHPNERVQILLIWDLTSLKMLAHTNIFPSWAGDRYLIISRGSMEKIYYSSLAAPITTYLILKLSRTL